MNIRQEKIPKHPLGAAAFSHCRVLWGRFISRGVHTETSRFRESRIKASTAAFNISYPIYYG